MRIHRFTESDGTFPIADTNDSAVIQPRLGKHRTGIFHCQQTNDTATNVLLYGSMDGNAGSYVLVHTFTALDTDTTAVGSAIVTLFPYMYVDQSANGSIRAYIGE
tara:strand:- start:273 stop:587 length:315 start_codon:yes stop_codon:yes gene_type:complete